MRVTEDTSQSPIGWSNAAARSNKAPMFVTEDTFQPPIGWLNALASLNILYMFVTEDTSQPPIGWSNAAAFMNISVMSVTRLTSQLGMSFNPAAPQSAPCIVQHASPDPSGDAATQLSTASLSAARSANGAGGFTAYSLGGPSAYPAEGGS